MKKLLHGALLVAILAAALALPYRLFIGPIPLASIFGGGGIDAVSSASVIQDAPSGEYVVLLNARRHEAWDSADAWAEFFAGESRVFMDDVDCMAGIQDAAGREMAESYRSRLPENKMKLRAEDGLMMLSKAQCGRFDVIVMSREFADARGAETLFGLEDVRVIRVGGAGE